MLLGPHSTKQQYLCNHRDVFCSQYSLSQETSAVIVMLTSQQQLAIAKQGKQQVLSINTPTNIKQICQNLQNKAMQNDIKMQLSKPKTKIQKKQIINYTHKS